MDTEQALSILAMFLASGGVWKLLEIIVTRIFTKRDKKETYVTREELKRMPTECAVKASVDELKIQENAQQNQIAMVSGGIQALLRDKLYHEYNKWTEKGYVPLYARENFENMYNWYHALGKNGVMDDLKDKFLQLPTEEPKKEEQN